MSKRKLRPGPHILSLDELARQEFIFVQFTKAQKPKAIHKGWFLSWQFKSVLNWIGGNGYIFYAMPATAETRFSDAEIIAAEDRLFGMATVRAREEAVEILNTWDDGLLNAEDVIDRYENEPDL